MPSAEAVKPEAVKPGTAKPSGSKGRPTPRRKDALQERQTRVRSSSDPKEAARQHRARVRDEKSKARQALLNGDERHLPARDKGPVRRYVRDRVDGRRSPGEYFLYTAVAMLGISIVRAPTAQAASVLILLVLTGAAVIDSAALSRRLRRELAERFPGHDTKGAVSYGVLRSLQVRRLRLPKPAVSPPSEGFVARLRARRKKAKADAKKAKADAKKAKGDAKKGTPARTGSAT